VQKPLGQYRTPVSGYQVSVWSHQGSLTWIEEEHGAALHPLYALESVDGEEVICEYHCLSAPKYRKAVAIDPLRGQYMKQEEFVSLKFT
jgi:hypothetical protein